MCSPGNIFDSDLVTLMQNIAHVHKSTPPIPPPTPHTAWEITHHLLLFFSPSLLWLLLLPLYTLHFSYVNVCVGPQTTDTISHVGVFQIGFSLPENALHSTIRAPV